MACDKLRGCFIQIAIDDTMHIDYIDLYELIWNFSNLQNFIWR